MTLDAQVGYKSLEFSAFYADRRGEQAVNRVQHLFVGQHPFTEDADGLAHTRVEIRLHHLFDIAPLFFPEIARSG